jgi:hypothetical protein
MIRSYLRGTGTRARFHRFGSLLVPAFVIGSLALAGCSSTSSSTTPTPSATATEVATATATPTAAPASSAPAASEAPSANAVPTVYDPCQLVTASEASALAGVTFPSGTKSDTPDGGKLCAYTAGTTVLEVLVGQSADAATAQAQEPAFKADLESGLAQAGIASPTLTELPGFESGVDAAVISGSVTIQGMKASAIAIYALKGAVFVAISDVTVGGTPPTSDAIQAQAHTTLGRISS